MKYTYTATIVFTLILSGCAAPTKFNIKNSSIPSQQDNSLSTYSLYGNDVEYNKDEKIHQLSVFTGGNAKCNSSLLAFAKPTLDTFMDAKGYSSYTVIKGQNILLPLSKCELYVRYEK